MNGQTRCYRSLWLVLLISLLVLSACQPTKPVPETPTEPAEASDEIQETETTTPEDTRAAPTPTEIVEITEEAAGVPGLPADPMPQSIQTEDGLTLEATFYPAAHANAPLVILMHWAPGDQTNWRAIAPWLQNRGEGQDIYDGPANWLDASWFPAIPEGESMNVLTFTFRGCQGGCQSFDREGWLLDVEAVMTHAALLEGVDPNRIMTFGASIGADGAAYGCQYYNQQQGSGCRGVISLSPGGYLTLPYPEVIEALENETPPKPAWCLYAAGDSPAAAACQGAEGALFQAFEYEGSDHGMALIIPDRDPNPLSLFLNFMDQYLLPLES